MSIRTKPSSETPNPEGQTPAAFKERVQWFFGEKNLNAIRDEAVILSEELELAQKQHALTKKQVAQLKNILAALREKFEAVMAHEHYSVVVTGVMQNGKMEAQVAGLGNTRVQVAVHPDIDINHLHVGATGVVTRERNCLLKVTSPVGLWKDVGRFEKYLEEPHRILIRDRETLIAVDVAQSLRETVLKKGDLIGFDRDVAGLAYERLETPKSEHLFDENVTDDFSQLGGLDKEVARIKRHIDFRFKFPGIASKYALKSQCGILLKGVPGNGKTRIARCCAGYVRKLFPDRPSRFMHVAGSADYNKWFGETEQRLIERFNAVREAAADGLVIMFFDEVDAIARRRGSDYGSGAPDRILNTFLSQLDGIVPLSNVIVIFATNRADTLDPGLLRPGRTDEKIEIPTPNRRATEAILRSYLQKGLPLTEASNGDGIDQWVSRLLSRVFAPNGGYSEVAQVKLSDGRRLPVAGRQLLSGAMLENVVGAAAQQAAVRETETGQEGLCEVDLAQAFESELIMAVSLLAPGNVKSYVNSIPQDAQPIAVDAVLKPSVSFIQ